MTSQITVSAGIVAIFIAIGAVGATAGDAQRAHGAGADLADVRHATARYHDEARARRDGYVPIGACAEQLGQGAMGIHYINPPLAADTVVDPRRPEMLLYEPQRDGRMRLVGVEWFVADADQDLATDTDRPSILGQAFDGPMPGHEPGMPVHYDLHAWIFFHNPAGDLAAWNPDVHCQKEPEMKRLLSVASALVVVGALIPGIASGASPTIERIAVDVTFVDELLSDACGVEVTTRARGHITVRTFERNGTGVVEVTTINLGLTATADGRVFRFRDVGADVTRIERDGTAVLQISGQVPFDFAGVLKIDLETGATILEPRDRSEEQLARACAVLTGG